MMKKRLASKKSLLCLAATAALPLSAAELIYQEGFNTDGEPAGRYTTTGREKYEVPRIQAEINNFDQKGPIYWAHNFEVSFVGNPNIPARRMIFAWRTDGAGGAASEDLLKLWDASVKWLLNNKAGATVVVHPNAASINELATRLTEMGYNVVDDDIATNPDEQDVVGDLFIHGPGASNASRFAMLTKPVIVMHEPDYDDMIVGSIGALATFDPGPVNIATPNHPAAGGLTGSFNGFNSTQQPFGLVGSFLPPGATTVATVTRTVSPSVSSLADVDAMIAGTKQNEKSDGTVTDIDFSDGSGGSWAADSAIPGGYTANWGLHTRGKLTVTRAGTYRIAMGSDDGARLRIDLDRNGMSATDWNLEDAGPHAHQFVYQDVTFPSSGQYDFDAISYNSAGGGSFEIAVSIDQAPVPDDAQDSGFWEILSTAGTAVKLQSAAAVTAYDAVGPDVQVQTPLVVLLNGPNDTPPGSFYDGGAFAGFEGTGFYGASGLNKWPYPEGQTFRSLRLKPVNVTGKTKVKLTIALAATSVDFETSDFLQVIVYPNGESSQAVTLADFKGVQNAVQPWLADAKENYVRRLTKQFADFTYDVPAGATDLVVEIRAATSWWTEIAAFDNIRITSGETGGGPAPTVAVAKQGANIVVTVANGTLQRANALTTPTSGIQWQPVTTTAGSLTLTPAEAAGRSFFRAVRQ